MARIVLGSARFDELDEVQAKLRLHGVGYFVGFEFEGCAFVFGHH